MRRDRFTRVQLDSSHQRSISLQSNDMADDAILGSGAHCTADLHIECTESAAAKIDYAMRIWGISRTQTDQTGCDVLRHSVGANLVRPNGPSGEDNRDVVRGMRMEHRRVPRGKIDSENFHIRV